jgi:CRISPR-associated protein Cmx8
MTERTATDDAAAPARPRKAKASPTGKAKASKPRATKPALPTGPVTLRWDLAELPSSQHKAGLAGLALCVRVLGAITSVSGAATCELVAIDASGLTLRVDRDGMQALFDDVYAATREEQERDKLFQIEDRRWGQGRRPAEGDPRTSRSPTRRASPSTKTFYVYEQTVPAWELIVGSWDVSLRRGRQAALAQALARRGLEHLPGRARARGSRMTPARKRERDPRRRRGVGRAHRRSPDASVELPSTYYLGAQARSAENVAFRDVARLRFLAALLAVRRADLRAGGDRPRR